jgi:xanthine dehydrogenase accessory factor
MRRELPDLLSLARRLLDSGEPGVLATLFSATGSSYRNLGSMMVSGPPGMLAGGVSGGCLEEYIARHGRELTRRLPATLLSFDTGNGEFDDPRPVLGCGSSIEILLERLMPDHIPFLQAMADAFDADEPSLFATLVRAEGENVFVRRGGPDSAPADLVSQAQHDRRGYNRSLSAGESILLTYIPPITRLVIFGAGEDVRPVVEMAHSLGWHVTVVDRRSRLARADRFPQADRVIPAEWGEAIEQIRFTPHTAAVLMTHSLPDDAEILPLLANRPMAYAGVLGPAHRRSTLLDLLEQSGSPTPPEFARNLHGPVGLDLGDRSAAGIAVSLISHILTCLNRRSARPLDREPDAAPAQDPTCPTPSS